jgi:hypothetical protein
MQCLQRSIQLHESSKKAHFSQVLESVPQQQQQHAHFYLPLAMQPSRHLSKTGQ